MTDTELKEYRSILKEIEYLDRKIMYDENRGLQCDDIKAKRNIEKDKLIELSNNIHEFIYSIERSEIRIILSLRYLEGYTQEKIANELYMDRSGVSKRITEFLKTTN